MTRMLATGTRWTASVLACLVAFAILAVRGHSQQSPSSSELPRFRVGVDVVRIDAVVTNRKGEIVTDVKPDEFEIYQDGKLQPVLVADFISTVAATPRARPPRELERSQPNAPLQPAPASAPGRIIALVVDDLGLSWEASRRRDKRS